MQRCTNNNLFGGIGLASYLNSSMPKKADLLELLNNNKNKNKTGVILQNPVIASKNIAAVTAGGVNAAKGNYDSKTGTWGTTGTQTEVYQDLVDRQGYNQAINNTLAAKGIKLTSKENITLTVDQDSHITVSGISNEQRRARIEAALNGTENLGSGLLLHIEKIKGLNGTQNPLELDKWLVADFLKDQAGQGLDDLKLVNGKITGANEKLQKIIDGEIEDTGKDAAYYKGFLADLKAILAYGPDKIEDMKVSIDFKNGSLIDKNVKYGFGPDQLKSWYSDVMSGRARLDAKA